MRKYFYSICVAFSMLFAPMNASSTVPTIDYAQIAQWLEQYQQMVTQIKTLKAQYAAISGSRGLGNIFNNSELDNYLPEDWREIYQAMQTGGYESITSGASEIYHDNMIFDRCAEIKNEISKSLCESDSVRSSQEADFISGAFDKSLERLEQIKELMNQVDATTDQKAIAEIQARIASEQNMIANEETKLQLFKMASETQAKLRTERVKQKNAMRRTKTGGIQGVNTSF